MNRQVNWYLTILIIPSAVLCLLLCFVPGVVAVDKLRMPRGFRFLNLPPPFETVGPNSDLQVEKLTKAVLLELSQNPDNRFATDYLVTLRNFLDNRTEENLRLLQAKHILLRMQSRSRVK